MPIPDYTSLDGDLLSSGRYADVEIRCGGESWQLHRAILMNRCRYFSSRVLKSDSVVEIDEHDPKKLYWVIHFIYTGQVPLDLMDLLDTQATVMSTCIDLFMLALDVGLDVLCLRADQVLTEYLIHRAAKIQDSFKSYDVEFKYLRREVNAFADPFLEAARTIYGASNPDDLKPLKEALMIYLRLTRYVLLRQDLFGEQFLTDPSLAAFLTDILRATIGLFQPLGPSDRVTVFSYCNKCDNMAIDVEFNEPAPLPKQPSICRDCKPIGEQNVMKLIGGEGYQGHELWKS